jgi:hypothetical protein
MKPGDGGFGRCGDVQVVDGGMGGVDMLDLGCRDLQSGVRETAVAYPRTTPAQLHYSRHALKSAILVTVRNLILWC